MTTFYEIPSAEQSSFLICLFFLIVVTLFYLLVSPCRFQSKYNRYLNVGLFLILLALLSILGEAFRNINIQQPYKILLPLPMWLLWCVFGVSGLLLLCEAVVGYRQRGKNLSRRCVKLAIDTLPSAICYFSASGAVKLCNLQMHRLYRSLAQSDMQTFGELQKALEECDTKSGIIRLPDVRQTYLFPDGKVWRYSKTDITASDGVVYTEVIFSDVTELYEKNLKLKEQTVQLKKISRNLKVLSDNVLTMTKEKELLAAKTRLHDRMSAGIIAIRQILKQEQTTEETSDAVSLFQKSVSAIKNDNEYPWERGELAEFLRDADIVGVKVELSGALPQQPEQYRVFLTAMRECLTNSVRHADATVLRIDIQKDDNSFSVRITNNGKPPENKVVPKGGLINLYSHVANLGGTVEIQSTPVFALTVTVPRAKEVTE